MCLIKYLAYEIIAELMIDNVLLVKDNNQLK